MGRWRTRIVLVLFAAVGAPLLIRGQSPQPPDQKPLAFEVASVKPSLSKDNNASNRALPGGRVTITNSTLRNIIRTVYRIQPYQLLGGPDWISGDRWDIVGQAAGDPPFERVLDMLKTLMAERFKLVTHRESRQMAVYALVVVTKDGTLNPHLHRSTVDCATVLADARSRGTLPPTSQGRPSCGIDVSTRRLVASGTTMHDLAQVLSGFAGRSVVDQTGLRDQFDLELTWSGDGSDLATTPTGTGPSLFTALPEQLGLKLEPTKAPVDVLVIDHVERPTPD
jgi:uncharacterized protein (TIGR03435 family)